MKALVYGKWVLNFEALKYEDSKMVDQSFMERVAKTEKIVSDCILATSMMLESAELPKGIDVVELYGGSGFQTLAIQNLLQPANHIIVEQDEECVNQLKREFPTATVIKGKAENNYKIKADYYAMDSNGWTVNTIATNKDKNREMYEAILGFAPKAILIFDSAKAYFMANRNLYSRHLGQQVSNLKEYAQALSDLFMKSYGYSVSRVSYLGRATFFLLQPGNNEMKEISIADAPTGVKGFQWI